MMLAMARQHHIAIGMFFSVFSKTGIVKFLRFFFGSVAAQDQQITHPSIVIEIPQHGIQRISRFLLQQNIGAGYIIGITHDVIHGNQLQRIRKV